ncbi:hypothetical protein QQF64_017395 [Cirrhinus molitorella]|uniref:CCHC-type domain-containing protein n=1 Tax=Cirrhinus molitorella TaxID=172907 RepID=A0ABR3LM56_9TELE
MERVKFVQTIGLCFGCLNSGHHSKKCVKRSVCDTCKGKYPTCLHEERDKEQKEIKQSKEAPNETISHCVVQHNSSDLTSTISPVWLSSTNNPEHPAVRPFRQSERHHIHSTRKGRGSGLREEACTVKAFYADNQRYSYAK